MLLTQTVLLASLASLAGPPEAHDTRLTAPLWAASFWSVSAPTLRAPWRTLHLSLCDPFSNATAIECTPRLPSPWVRGSLAAATYLPAELWLPRMSEAEKVDEALGGFMHFDLVRALNLRAGPQVSWLTPESPREDLLELRVVAPGWGVRYAWDESPLSVGLSACTRFVMLGETGPVVDVLTAEARLELLLH